MNAASRNMREFLESQQRKKEEFWQRKYGMPAPACGNSPVLPALSPNRSAFPALEVLSPSGNGGSGGGFSPSAEKVNGRVALPPLAHASKAPSKGVQPLFHAQGPIKNFFTRNGLDASPRGGGAAGGAGGVAAVAASPNSPQLSPVHKLPPLQQPAAPATDKRRCSARQGPKYLPPLMPGDAVLTLDSPREQEGDACGTGLSPTGGGDGGSSGVPSPMKEKSWSLWKPAADPPKSQGLLSTAFPRHKARQPSSHTVCLPPLPALDVVDVAPRVNLLHHRPLRDMELELAVLKAVKGREDNMERLKAACQKLEQHFCGQPPRFMSQSDPMVRLFFRLVHTHRQRTLDAIETLAAWRRKTAAAEPFVHNDRDYLANIGPDMAFLGDLGFLQSQPLNSSDPFLAGLTSDGVPIDEATALDARRGHTHFSADALRIRAARKVLAAYRDALGLARLCLQQSAPESAPPLVPPAACQQQDDDDLQQESSSSFAVAMLESPTEDAPSVPTGEESYAAERKRRADDAHDDVRPARRGATDPRPSAAGPTGGTAQLSHSVVPPTTSTHHGPLAGPLSAGAQAFEQHVLQASGGFAAADLAPLRAVRTATPIDGAAIGSSSAGGAPAQQPPLWAALSVAVPTAYSGLTDEDFLDVTLEVLVASLQPAIVDTVTPFRFTMAGWAALAPLVDDEDGEDGRSAGPSVGAQLLPVAVDRDATAVTQQQAVGTRHRAVNFEQSEEEEAGGEGQTSRFTPPRSGSAVASDMMTDLLGLARAPFPTAVGDVSA